MSFILYFPTAKIHLICNRMTVRMTNTNYSVHSVSYFECLQKLLYHVKIHITLWRAYMNLWGSDPINPRIHKTSLPFGIVPKTIEANKLNNVQKTEEMKGKRIYFWRKIIITIVGSEHCWPRCHCATFLQSIGKSCGWG